MPIVVRNGMQYQLEGPNDVPSSGNRIGPVPGTSVGGFGQGASFAAPGQTFAPNLGSWAPPTPEYLTAPGYETYAPTKAYGYSPTGGDWSGAYPGYGYGYGGGGGGGLTSGDFGGGTDNSTLGGLLSAASLLGGANNLSSFLTGKSLLEHAGIDNPFSNFLGGGEGLSFTDYLPNAIKDALNIYPSQAGLLTAGGGTSLLTPLQGEAMVNALGGTGPGTLSSQFTEAMNAAGGPWPQATPAQLGSIQPRPPGFTSMAPGDFWGDSVASQAFRDANSIYPSYGASTELGTAALTDAQHAAFVEAMGGAAPPAPLIEGLIPSPVGEGFISPQIEALYGGEFLGSSSAPFNDVGHAMRTLDLAQTPSANVTTPYIQALAQDIGNQMITSGAAAASNLSGLSAATPMLGYAYTGTPSLFAPTTLGMGSIPAATGAAATAPAAGLGAGAGLLGPAAIVGLALAMRARSKANFDPTAEARRANAYENAMQGAGGGIPALEEAVYNDRSLLQLIKDVTSGGNRAAPFGTPHTSGGIEPISWSENVSKKVQENMHLLEAASAAGQMADPASDQSSPGLVDDYKDVKRGATFNSANDPFGHREREAAAGGEFGMFNAYVPSGRNLNALKNSYQDVFTR